MTARCFNAFDRARPAFGAKGHSDLRGEGTAADPAAAAPAGGEVRDRRRVALVVSSFLPSVGGAELVAYNLARALEAHGYDPYVIANFKPFVFALRRRLPLRVLPLPPLLLRLTTRAPKLTLGLIRLILGYYQRRYRFSLWYANSGFPAGVLVADFCHRHGLACTLRCSGEDIQVRRELDYGARRNPGADALVRRYYPSFRRVVATTGSMKTEFMALGIPEAAIEVIPNPLDTRRFGTIGREERRSVRAARGVGDQFLFLAVGRNHPKKDFRTLVEAAGILVHEHGLRDFRILFVGTGFEPLARLVALRKLRDYVSFTAVDARPDPAMLEACLPADELIALYQAADCFVLPSFVEGFPNVVAEAMAAGLPIVTTDAPGCRDLVSGFGESLLFPPGDAAALAERMVRVMNDADLRAELSRQGRRASQAFATDVVLARYLALFAGLADTPTPGARKAVAPGA